MEMSCIIERKYVFVMYDLKGKAHSRNKYLAFYERSRRKRKSRTFLRSCDRAS